MTFSSYQIIIFGSLDARLDSLRVSVKNRALDLGIDERAFEFITGSGSSYDRQKPAIGIYFGHHGKPVPQLLNQLISDSIIIAPVVTSKVNVKREIPDLINHINVTEVPLVGGSINRLASLVFETFRLLRKERGIFISYRRKGSQPLANRLYEQLDRRGFDVFIDVRSVPPAVDFQAELWHRMSDVDTIVLIDTPGFREGRWTKAELAQANLLGIQTLHLLWPGQKEEAAFAFSRFMNLDYSHFKNGKPGRGGGITNQALNEICDRAEVLRAQAIALRHAHLVDNFCDAARDLKLNPVVQPQRWISVEAHSKPLAVVPAVGRPTSDRINEIFDSISKDRDDGDAVWVIYDSRGLHEAWVNHLRWLDSHLPIRTVTMADVPAELKAFAA